MPTRTKVTAPTQFPSGWHCYLLLCEDGSYYCGITGNMNRRMRDHATNQGSSYTKGTRPIALVWTESHKTRASAAKREMQLKNWGRDKKSALATGKGEFEGLGTAVRVSLG